MAVRWGYSVLQAGSAILKKEGTPKLPTFRSSWCNFCSRHDKRIQIKGQKCSTGNSRCSKWDSFVRSGIITLRNFLGVTGCHKFWLHWRKRKFCCWLQWGLTRISDAPFTLCANRFFKRQLLTLKILYYGSDFSRLQIHLPPLCLHFFFLPFNSRYSYKFLLLCKFQHHLSNLFKSPTILNSAEIMFCLEAFKWQRL